jgi:hypothetical protein
MGASLALNKLRERPLEEVTVSQDPAPLRYIFLEQTEELSRIAAERLAPDGTYTRLGEFVAGKPTAGAEVLIINGTPFRVLETFSALRHQALKEHPELGPCFRTSRYEQRGRFPFYAFIEES